MSTLYVRIHPKRNVSRFFRCGTAFGHAWTKLEKLDAATVKRLRTEQMLETSESEPEDWEEAEPAPEDDKAVSEQKTAEALAEENAQRMQAIRDAVAKLDPADVSLWTGSGKPKTEAIAAVLGYSISATERDNALELGGKS